MCWLDDVVEKLDSCTIHINDSMSAENALRVYRVSLADKNKFFIIIKIYYMVI